MQLSYLSVQNLRNSGLGTGFARLVGGILAISLLLLWVSGFEAVSRFFEVSFKTLLLFILMVGGVAGILCGIAKILDAVTVLRNSDRKS